jgi:Methylamine utilisation protein MauE
MSETLVRLASAVLAVTFGWASVAKVIGFARWRAALSRYRIGPSVERIAAPTVPVLEAGVCALLVSGRLLTGATLTMALVSCFSLAVARARSGSQDKLPCGCFGRATVRDPKELLLRNALLGALAAIVLVFGRDGAFAGPAPHLPSILPTLLAGVGIVVGAWTTWQVATTLRERAHR